MIVVRLAGLQAPGQWSSTYVTSTNKGRPKHAVLQIICGPRLPPLQQTAVVAVPKPQLWKNLQQCRGKSADIRGGPTAPSKIQPDLEKGVVKKTCCFSSSWSFQ